MCPNNDIQLFPMTFVLEGYILKCKHIIYFYLITTVFLSIVQFVLPNLDEFLLSCLVVFSLKKPRFFVMHIFLLASYFSFIHPVIVHQLL